MQYRDPLGCKRHPNPTLSGACRSVLNAVRMTRCAALIVLFRKFLTRNNLQSTAFRGSDEDLHRVAKQRQGRGAQKWTFCSRPCTSGSLRSRCGDVSMIRTAARPVRIQQAAAEASCMTDSRSAAHPCSQHDGVATACSDQRGALHDGSDISDASSGIRRIGCCSPAPHPTAHQPQRYQIAGMFQCMRLLLISIHVPSGSHSTSISRTFCLRWL